jgi:hypothetical protein
MSLADEIAAEFEARPELRAALKRPDRHAERARRRTAVSCPSDPTPLSVGSWLEWGESPVRVLGIDEVESIWPARTRAGGAAFEQEVTQNIGLGVHDLLMSGVVLRGLE